MYDDIGDYIPDVKRRSTTHNDRHKNPHEHDNAKKVYFHNSSKSAPADEPGPGGADAVKSFIRSVHNKYKTKDVRSSFRLLLHWFIVFQDEEHAAPAASSKSRKNGFGLKFTDDSYAECYPG